MTALEAERAKRSFKREIFIVCLLGSHLLFNTVGLPNIAGTLLCVVSTILFCQLASKWNWFEGLALFVFGIIAFAFVVYLLGELLHPIVTSRPAMSVYLGIVSVGVLRLQPAEPIPTTRKRTVFILALLTSTAWLLTQSISNATKVTFLGYGYDNTAHLMQARMILDQGGTFLVSGGSTAGPTFLQDASQTTGALNAALASLTGVKSDNFGGFLSVFVLLTVIVPLVALVAPALFALRTGLSRGCIVILLATSIILITTGYFSRIWFSGYLASNIATTCLVVLLIWAISGTARQPALLILGAALTGHVYTLYGFVAGILILPFVIRQVFPLHSLQHRLRQLFPKWTTTLALFFLVTLIFPLMATRRSYSASHFLADGGIEYLPTRYTIIVFTLLFVVAAVLFLGHKDFGLLVVLFGCTFIALTAGWYSIEKVERLAYYPTKIIITATLVGAAVVIATVGARARTSSGLFFLLTVVSGSAMALQPESQTFRTAYMGTTPTVFSSIIKGRPEVVDGTTIMTLVDHALHLKKPILLVSRFRESELNSRWVNTLSMHWTDKSWSDWMRVSALITSDGYTALQSLPEDLDLAIATDDPNLLGNLNQSMMRESCYLFTTSQCLDEEGQKHDS
jgi:hypothetical protein